MCLAIYISLHIYIQKWLDWLEMWLPDVRLFFSGRITWFPSGVLFFRGDLSLVFIRLFIYNYICTSFCIWLGRSGVKIGIESSGDPVWTDFGDMFANWQFTNLVDGGTMDVSTMAYHIVIYNFKINSKLIEKLLKFSTVM